MVSEDQGKLTVEKKGGEVSPFPQVCKLPDLICGAYAFLCFVLFSVMRLRNCFIVNKELSGGREEMRDIWMEAFWVPCPI